MVGGGERERGILSNRFQFFNICKENDATITGGAIQEYTKLLSNKQPKTHGLTMNW